MMSNRSVWSWCAVATSRGVRASRMGGFAAVLLTVLGCGTGVGVVETLEDGNRDATLTSSLGKTSGEPNDTFQGAVVAVFDSSGVARLQGTISTRDDIDVYRLSTWNAGTMITVDAATSGSQLDVTVALFDAAQNLVFANDDRGGSPSRFLDSYALWTTRHVSDSYFLVVAASAFAGSGQVLGSYTVDIEATSDMGTPPPVPQTILLDFSGSLVDSAVLGVMQLAPFDASLISSAYAGQSDTMKQLIVETVRQNFERFDVTVISSDDDASLAPDTYTTIYMGDFSSEVFGLAENVDLYNYDRCDDAIIFTESFNPDVVFSFTPSVEEMALAIGNIAAHEAGHLLGLFHVSDDTALMDDASPADAFIFDQEFKRAPLSGDVVEIGAQDGVLLLYEIVGPSR